MIEDKSSTNNSMNNPPTASLKSGPVSSIPGSYFTAILSEPLLHFLLIGALVFGGYTYLQNDTRSTPQKICSFCGKDRAFGLALFAPGNGLRLASSSKD